VSCPHCEREVCVDDLCGMMEPSEAFFWDGIEETKREAVERALIAQQWAVAIALFSLERTHGYGLSAMHELGRDEARAEIADLPSPAEMAASLLGIETTATKAVSESTGDAAREEDKGP
jgi:hypothetical protein